jgi:hypothetical protein
MSRSEVNRRFARERACKKGPPAKRACQGRLVEVPRQVEQLEHLANLIAPRRRIEAGWLDRIGLRAGIVHHAE